MSHYKSILFIVGISISLCVPAIAQEYMSPGGKWVNVMNPHPISSENNDFVFDDKCIIDETGMIKYLGDGLALYQSDHSAGTLCPNGTIFEVSHDDLKQWTKEYHDIMAAKSLRREAICKKLGVSCD